MEYMGLNSFFFVGILCFVAARYTVRFESLDRDEQLSDPRKSQMDIPLIEIGKRVGRDNKIKIE